MCEGVNKPDGTSNLVTGDDDQSSELSPQVLEFLKNSGIDLSSLFSLSEDKTPETENT